MPKPTSEREIVMVLVVVGHLQKRSAMQAEKADDFELGKTTAGLLAAILWPLETFYRFSRDFLCKLFAVNCFELEDPGTVFDLIKVV